MATSKTKKTKTWGAGHDLINVGNHPGYDEYYGGDGNNYLDGRGRWQYLYGEGGNDYLEGQGYLYGGTGTTF